jgi:pimeloyl-ACP methyl ester carboxylesterase
MAGKIRASIHEHRVRRVEEAFSSLPDRYLGADPGFDATFQIRLGDIGRCWEVRATEEGCRVFSPPRRKAEVEIGTDSQTWLALREGRLSGLDAFSQRRLWARGNLDLAVCFEGLFHLPGGRHPLIRIYEVAAGAQRISTLSSGTGPEHAILVHGLGGNKTSFFETVSALAPRYTVHAIDLPGFGSSSKPARAPYDAPWFAESVLAFMDELGIERAHVVGNSMGGRVALELGLAAPERVRSLSLLAPAVAFRRRRELVPLVKLLRPELAAIPHPLRQALVRDHFWALFAHPERLDPSVAEIACDEFIRTYRTRQARIAFFAAARNIYLDAPFGDAGFWTRLSELAPPTLFVWGGKDFLVPAKFARHVAEALPAARQVTFEDCGHVPQVELPDRTNELLLEQMAGIARSEQGRLRRMARIA